MSRALDHLVIGTPDLDRAGARFGALGFIVGAHNRHPWGTQNRIVQFSDESFLELISVAEPGLIRPHTPGHFSFGAFVRDALARRPGLSMLVLKSADARKDAEAFRAAKIGDFAPFDFARVGKGPDGQSVDVAFSLAFAMDATMPECGFFACQHHHPQNFWSGAAQSHANAVKGVARVTIVSENPSDQHIFLSAFTGNREMRATSFGIEISAGRAVIEIVSPEGFAFRYGEAAPAIITPRFAGIEFLGGNLSTVEQAAKQAGISLHAHAGGLCLTSGEFGTAMRFIASGEAAR